MQDEPWQNSPRDPDIMEKSGRVFSNVGIILDMYATGCVDGTARIGGGILMLAHGDRSSRATRYLLRGLEGGGLIDNDVCDRA